jgi:peptidoglycan-N-acetylglucosamine deacetylase
LGLLCVSIDLDDIRCYHAIHGLEPPKGETAHVIYKKALTRAARFFEELHIVSTLFVVGGDLDGKTGDSAGAILRDLAQSGHELGNHTFSHRYDFTMLQVGEQANEIDRTGEMIAARSGVRPKGFRAPGYNMNLGVIALLAERGYTYDSSVFPCPLYYSAKAAAVGIKRVQGYHSSSLIGDPRVLTAPHLPYRINEEEGLWSRGEGLKELPISVVTKARLPFLGTSLTMMGRLPAKILARSAARLPFVNLELHGIDFADADEDGLGYLKKYQPDLRVPIAQKQKTLRGVIKTLIDNGHEPVTLADAAQRLFI